jgi:hypothetical protein
MKTINFRKLKFIENMDNIIAILVLIKNKNKT